ncbi:MAG: dihydrolipoamide acetyltransferase family protein [Actinomycetota bacterium]
MANVVMPQLGETVLEGTVVRWLKQEGERITLDEPLFEISTDKVDTEVPSPAEGVLERILVAEGQTVPVGTELAIVGTGESAAGEALSEEVPRMAAPAESATEVPAIPAAPAAPVASAPLGTSAAAEVPTPPPAPAVPESVSDDAGTEAGERLPDRGPRSAILSPVVRRLAREHDVDLARVRGTGPGGRITRHDVEGAIVVGNVPPDGESAALSAPEAAPAIAAEPPPVAQAPPSAVTPVASVSTPAAPSSNEPAVTRPEAPVVANEDEEVQPLSHLRRAIAGHMLQSTQTAARAWTLVEVDMERIVRLRERVKEAFAAREGFKLTYMPFVTRATNEALLEFPMVNAELRGQDLILRRHVHMGIAVSIDGGLIVPVVRNGDEMNLVGLARAIDDLATRARGKQLQPDEVHGSTFSITNPGAYGSLSSLPIINQPNSAILSFDAIEKRPVVVDDAIAIRHRVYLSMSWDHRVIDGAMATLFLTRVKEHLETWDWDEDLDHG